MRTRVAAPIVYAAGIFVASSIPSAQLPSSRIWDYDKLIHLLVFAGLGALVYQGVYAPSPGAIIAGPRARTDGGRASPPAWRRFWSSVGVTAAYGVLDELHQGLTPGRHISAWDALADLAGALAGVSLCYYSYYSKERDGNPA